MLLLDQGRRFTDCRVYKTYNEIEWWWWWYAHEDAWHKSESLVAGSDELHEGSIIYKDAGSNTNISDIAVCQLLHIRHTDIQSTHQYRMLKFRKPAQLYCRMPGCILNYGLLIRWKVAVMVYMLQRTTMDTVCRVRGKAIKWCWVMLC